MGVEGMNKWPQLYSLSGDCEEVSIHRQGWGEPRPVHLETVEISPQLFCFEWGDEEFREGDDLHLNLHLPDGILDMAVTILSVEESGLLEEGYDLQRHFTYCAQFQAEIEWDSFRKIKGTPRKCKSSSGSGDEDKAKSSYP
jgi:hypothetical protein